MRALPLVLSLLCAASGCAHGLSRTELAASLAVGREQLEVTDEEIARALSLKPQLGLPARVGVYFEPWSRDHRPGASTHDWTLRDREALLSIARDLRSAGVASDVFLISEAAVPPSEPDRRLRSLRLAAARHGADALLVVRGAAEVDEYVNALSVFYPTLVGMLLPGSHCDVLFLAEGTLWDVRNQYLYLAEEAEGRVESVRPLPWVHAAARVDEARLEALASFRGRLLERAKELASREALRRGSGYATQGD